MAHEHHTWRLGADPPAIRPHSLAKHRVLGSYLRRYVEVLTANPRQELFKLTLVDGFSGGGLYLDERTREVRSGSPMIMLEAMAAAQARARELRSKAFHLDVRYIFVEKNREALVYLRNSIEKSEHRHLLDDNIDLLEGEFLTHAPTIVEQIEARGKSPRAIFFLDQFGYAAVPMPALRNILKRLGNAEVILTFATDSLIDYLSENEQSRKILEKVGISPPDKPIEKQHHDWRRMIQLHLHREIPLRTEAKYYTPFFIRSTDSHRDFWLVHLSGHYRARDVMVGLHWSENTSFAHYGGSGLNMLGYDPVEDFRNTQQKMLPVFQFDKIARASSHEVLLDQLSERLRQQADPMSFSQLFAAVTNETPVTSGIMKDVLAELAGERRIQVRDNTGLTARRTRIQHDTDIIVVDTQRWFF